MFIHKLLIPFLMMAFTASGPAQDGSTPQVPPDAEIHKILIQRIDTYHRSMGIVVGVIDPQGRRIIALLPTELTPHENRR